MAKATAKKATRRRRERKNIERGAAHIQSTFNNTIVTISIWIYSRLAYVKLFRFHLDFLDLCYVR